MDCMSRRLNDTESLLWSLEQNPHLSAAMGTLVQLDGNPDPQRLRDTFSGAVENVPALHERVKESGLPLDQPVWTPDINFDLDYHLRFVRLPSGATKRDLYDTACRLLNDPFDRTRPLWQLHVIGGLKSRRSAILIKLHHSIADGSAALKLAENLVDFGPDAAPKEPADLDALRAAWRDEEEAPKTRSVADAIRIGAERVISILNDATGTLSDPGRIASAGSETLAAARSLVEQAPGNEPAGSELLESRSRNRKFLAFKADLGSLKEAASSRELSLNDLFVGVAGQATLAYHAEHGEEIEALRASVIVSTRREDGDDRPNAFVPVALTVPGGDATTEEQALAVSHQVRAKREQLKSQPDLLGVVGSMAGLAPSALVATVAAEQAARLDFATSNLPGSPIPLWLAGTKIKRMTPIGPVGGTAFNLTLLTYGSTADMGLHVDPVAVTDPELLRSLLIDALADVGVKAS